MEVEEDEQEEEMDSDFVFIVAFVFFWMWSPALMSHHGPTILIHPVATPVSNTLSQTHHPPTGTPSCGATQVVQGPKQDTCSFKTMG